MLEIPRFQDCWISNEDASVLRFWRHERTIVPSTGSSKALSKICRKNRRGFCGAAADNARTAHCGTDASFRYFHCGKLWRGKRSRKSIRLRAQAADCSKGTERNGGVAAIDFRMFVNFTGKDRRDYRGKSRTLPDYCRFNSNSSQQLHLKVPEILEFWNLQCGLLKS